MTKKRSTFISMTYVSWKAVTQFLSTKTGVVALMQGPEVSFRIRLNLGEGRATAWGCNLSEEYVTFNSAYST